ncbi:MAG: DUF6807 domain-containing protein, partial [Planctomycetota bacterium]
MHLLAATVGAMPGLAVAALSIGPPCAAAPPGADPPAAAAVAFERLEDRVTVRLDGAPFTEFRFGSAPKPMLYPVLGPGGLPVTRGYPVDPRPDEQHDHPHQTSQWFAHGAVNGHDFWTGRGGAHIAIVGEPRLSAAEGTVAATLAWRAADGTTVCTERRTMRFGGIATARFVDFDITVTASDGPVLFGDTKEGTFALRLAPTLRLAGPVAGGACLNAAGQRDGACWGKRAAWVEYSGPVRGRTVGVAIFDHPGNPRHPTWWHARDYGLFAANP